MNKIIVIALSLITKPSKVIYSISASMKQTTLNRFIAKSSSESDEDDEEYVDIGSKVRKGDIFYWTKVQSREQMGKKQHAIYNVGEDLTSLRRNKLYTKKCMEGADHFMFDVNDYPMKQPDIVPDNYSLTAE